MRTFSAIAKQSIHNKTQQVENMSDKHQNINTTIIQLNVLKKTVRMMKYPQKQHNHLFGTVYYLQWD